MPSLIKEIKFIGTNKDALIQLVQEAYKEAGNLKLTIEPWSDKRGLSANAQIHVWYKQIADMQGDDVKSIENQCKRQFGVPILRESAKYKDRINFTFDRLGFFDWAWQSQCNYMELLPVTRLFTTKQHKQYRDAMQNYYNQQGYGLAYLGE